MKVYALLYSNSDGDSTVSVLSASRQECYDAMMRYLSNPDSVLSLEEFNHNEWDHKGYHYEKWETEATEDTRYFEEEFTIISKDI